MSKGYFTKFLIMKPKDFFTIFFLLYNSLSWFFMIRRIIYTTLNTLGTTHQESLLIWGIYDLAIIGSSVVGAVLSDKIKRFKLLCLWLLLGIVASSLPIFLSDISFTYVLGMSFLWGISFGLGMPSCLAHFANRTSFENRGRIGGIIFFAISISTPLVVMLSYTNLQLISIISAVWRGVGFAMILLLKIPEENVLEKGKHISLIRVLQNRSFLLYLVPWFMFSFIAGFEKLIFEHLLESDVYEFLGMIESIIGTFFALVGGLISDWIGRKRVVIYGFISLGLAYAVVGILPISPLSWLFNRIVDGIAWGMFLVLFVSVLWGDLSPRGIGSAERYYVVGSIPFFFADFIGSLFTPYVWIPASAAFSMASFFLFTAVLPLMYAPETLPAKKIELRRLRKYVEAARKVKEKYEEKGVKS